MTLPWEIGDPAFGRGLYQDFMSRSHGLCQLKLDPANEYYELILLKGILLWEIVEWDAIYPLHN